MREGRTLSHFFLNVNIVCKVLGGWALDVITTLLRISLALLDIPALGSLQCLGGLLCNKALPLRLGSLDVSRVARLVGLVCSEALRPKKCAT